MKLRRHTEDELSQAVTVTPTVQQQRNAMTLRDIGHALNGRYPETKPRSGLDLRELADGKFGVTR